MPYQCRNGVKSVDTSVIIKSKVSSRVMHHTCRATRSFDPIGNVEAAGRSACAQLTSGEGMPTETWAFCAVAAERATVMKAESSEDEG